MVKRLSLPAQYQNLSGVVCNQIKKHQVSGVGLTEVLQLEQDAKKSKRLYPYDCYDYRHPGRCCLAGLCKGSPLKILGRLKKIKMKILLIDNHTEHKKALAKALAEHEVEVQKYRPGLDFHTEGKDIVILSGGGGQGREIYDEHQSGHLWYQDEINFVKNCQKPILGICMGFEIICRAYGSKVDEMAKVLEGPTDLKITRKGKKLLSHSKICQHEAHKWRVKKAPRGFKVLAKSPTGVEIIKHTKKPDLATQFHPEKGGTLKLNQLIQATI